MLKKITELLMIIIAMLITMALLLGMFIGAVLQESEKLCPLSKRYGTVIEQTYEGWEEYNDYYIIEFENGDTHEIEADDLWPGDEVTVYFDGGEPVRTLYGRR